MWFYILSAIVPLLCALVPEHSIISIFLKQLYKKHPSLSISVGNSRLCRLVSNACEKRSTYTHDFHITECRNPLYLHENSISYELYQNSRTSTQLTQLKTSSHSLPKIVSLEKYKLPYRRMRLT